MNYLNRDGALPGALPRDKYCIFFHSVQFNSIFNHFLFY